MSLLAMSDRVQAMVKIVTEKLGQDAGSVLAAMMAHACRFETRVNVSGSCYVMLFLDVLYTNWNQFS
jgi:hypothetical protein